MVESGIKATDLLQPGAEQPAGTSGSSAALLSLVRLLARQVARETFRAWPPTTSEAGPMAPLVCIRDGTKEK